MNAPGHRCICWLVTSGMLIPTMTAIGSAAQFRPLHHKIMLNALALFHAFCDKFRGVPLRISLFLLEFRPFPGAIPSCLHKTFWWISIRFGQIFQHFVWNPEGYPLGFYHILIDFGMVQVGPPRTGGPNLIKMQWKVVHKQADSTLPKADRMSKMKKQKLTAP